MIEAQTRAEQNLCRSELRSRLRRLRQAIQRPGGDPVSFLLFLWIGGREPFAGNPDGVPEVGSGEREVALIEGQEPLRLQCSGKDQRNGSGAIHKDQMLQSLRPFRRMSVQCSEPGHRRAQPQPDSG